MNGDEKRKKKRRKTQPGFAEVTDFPGVVCDCPKRRATGGPDDARTTTGF